jgi:hypothetical protein
MVHSSPETTEFRADLQFARHSFRYKIHGVMNIYFGFTVAGDRSSIVTARVIVELLESMGPVVLTRHLVQDNAWEADRPITPQQFYQRDMAWLAACDCLMVEVSGSSFGLGFETGYLLGATEKDAVLFYRREMENKISLLITGNTHPRCTLVPYSDVEEIKVFVASRMAAIAAAG